MDITKLRILRDVASRGSIAATARALGYTPSAISQQLSTLERTCGTQLLERTHRGVSLTPAGRLLERRAQRVLAEIELAESEMALSSSETGGMVRVGTFASAGVAFCARAAADLALTHPHLELHLLEVEPTGQPQSLLLGELDVALVVSWDHEPLRIPPELVSRRILSEQMLIAHRDDIAVPHRLADLREQRWVFSPENTTCGRAGRAACRTAGFEPYIAHITDDFGVALAYAAAGLGVSLIPPIALRNQNLPPRTLLSCVDPPVVRHVELLTRASNTDHPTIAAVLSAFEQAAVGPALAELV